MIDEALKYAQKIATTDYERAEFKLNERRYRETLEFLVNEVPTESKVLEIGCTPGVFTLALTQLGYSLYGVDINPKGCDKAVLERSLIKQCNLDFENIPFFNDFFDCVLFAEVFEHLHPFRTKTVMEDIFRCLKPKGTLIFSTPNFFALENRIFMLIGGINSLGGGITPTHHTREYGIKEIVKIFKETNFNIKEIHFSTARDLVTVNEGWKNSGRKLLYIPKRLIPSFRSSIFVIAKKP
jgi:2-polyprenyl-3-methyl-5-hydroxy-6-metoxy-1,4-benzoquinol methylase